ncbi:MAG: hypothetical protein L0229_22690 [Blastocatellia bacterium]|nr:hypothetical protein [Blastocatellia bacterium]
MNRYFYRTILAVIALTMFGAVTAQAQTGTQHTYADETASIQAVRKVQERMRHDMAKMDMSYMMNEPHHVMARAYRQNIETFAITLRDQAQAGRPLSADFARAAVAEINRSFDKLEDHHQEHLKTMSADMRSRMAAMIKEMDMRHSKLEAAIAVLEKDVQGYTLNSEKIATDSAAIIQHLDEMSKMHNGN